MDIFGILALILGIDITANGVLLSDGVLLGDGLRSGTDAGVRIDPEG